MESQSKVVVSISGGKDSTALYLLALEQHGHNFIPVFADTGNEHQITLEYISTLADKTGGPAIETVRANFTKRIEKRREFILENYEEERIQSALHTLDVAQREGSAFFLMAAWKGMFPCNVKRFCTSELKTIPIAKGIYAPLIDEGFSVESWQGIRADESLARSTAKEHEVIGESVVAYRPLLKWTVAEVFAMHKRHGLEPNPLYKLGMSRVGCMPCLMSRKSEIAQISRRFPEHIEKIKRWERLVQLASKKGVSTFFPCHKVPGIDDMRSTVSNVVQWATSTVEGQLSLPLHYEQFSSCQSAYGLCE